MNLVWSTGAGVDADKVELAGNEEEHTVHRGKAIVAAGFALSRLEQA
jgi:hypothetical protein